VRFDSPLITSSKTTLLGTAFTSSQLTKTLMHPRNDGGTPFKYRGLCSQSITVGRCAGLESFVCDNNGVRSVDVAAYNYDRQSRPFSTFSDSGSLIFNGKREMVALLHSGKAKTGSSSPSREVD
jgi:hypothetical protein